MFRVIDNFCKEKVIRIHVKKTNKATNLSMKENLNVFTLDNILLHYKHYLKNITEKRKLCEYIAATALLIFEEMLKPDGSCVYDKFILMCCACCVTISRGGRTKLCIS